jgi:hypothetical protein
MCQARTRSTVVPTVTVETKVSLLFVLPCVAAVFRAVFDVVAWPICRFITVWAPAAPTFVLIRAVSVS